MSLSGSLQTKKGMYYAVVNLYDAEGRRKPRWVSTGIPVLGNNKREANAALRRILDTYESGGVIAAEGVLFSEYIKQWLETIKPDIDQVTWEGYSSYAAIHVIPYFEARKLKVNAVTVKHIEDYYAEKRKNGRVDGKGGLSPTTIKLHSVVIKGTLNYALKNNLIPYNPADRARLPKRDTRFVGKFYTIEQGKELLRAAEGTSIESVVLLALYYGFRRSEVCGLKWSAVDFQNDTITVSHTVVKLAQSRIEKDRTKNKASNRTLPLLANVKEYLLSLEAQQARDKGTFGNAYHDTDYICRWPDGRPLEPDYVTRKFSQVIVQAEMPPIRFHDLRHTTASILLSLGFSIKDIGDWLGHSDYSTTANIYAHLDLSRKKDIAGKLNKSLERKR